MAQIVWDPVALDHLEGIANWIAKDSPVAANRFIKRIFKRLERIEMFPLSGGFIAEDNRQIYREIIQGNYRVIYRVSDDTVFTVAVYHAARLLDRSLIP
ncbi:MAG: type II toxin-antitoxin system RelE/ParE family toxin [Pirellulaceae bacterium]